MRAPIEIDGARGFAYGDLPPLVREHAADWLRRGAVPGAEVIRENRLFRIGDLAVKIFGRHRRNRFRDRWRSSPGVRFADLARRIEAVETPRPVVALDLVENGAWVRSLVCYGWIDGTTLERLWRDDPAAVEAFPVFLAAMHRARVFHGDFHLHQALWDEACWFLIDLDGLRHPLRTLRARRLAVDHWLQVVLGLEVHGGVPAAAVQGMFGRYVAAGGVLPASAWSRILGRLGEHRAVRGLPEPEPGAR